MLGLMLVALMRLYFTAPADVVAPAVSGLQTASLSAPSTSARSYMFYQLDSRGTLVAIPGWADSLQQAILKPHAAGTMETVWLAPATGNAATTIYVLSFGSNGSLSAPSNACVIGRAMPVAAGSSVHSDRMALPVPVVRGARERCGETALAMVLRYYGADPGTVRQLESAHDPALRGSLITDLAVAARRAGYDAAVATLTPEALIELLDAGVPPILLYQKGVGPLTVRHFGVVTGWDESNASFTVLDGGAHARVTSRGDLTKRWRTAGSQALIVRQVKP